MSSHITTGFVNPRIVIRPGEHHFRRLTNPDVNRKRMYQLFCYMTLLVSLS